MRRAPSEQCDYVFEGSAADCYIENHRADKEKNQIYRGVAQLVARLLWEHRRCSHRTKAKTAESPSTVRISGGSENEKKQSKMCLTTDLTTYTQKPKNSIQNRGVAQLGARDIWDVEAAGSNPVTPTRLTSPN